MTRNSVPTPTRRTRVAGSFVLVIAAALVAVPAVMVPGFNGLSLVAAILAMLSVVRRAIESRNTPHER